MSVIHTHEVSFRKFFWGERKDVLFFSFEEEGQVFLESDR